MEVLRRITEDYVPELIKMRELGCDMDLREGAIRCAVVLKGKLVGVVDFWEDDIAIEPHIEWHPEASKREKYAAFLAGMRDMSAEKHVVLKVIKEQTPFFELMAKRKILRRVGQLTDIKTHGIDSLHIYQLNRSKV